MRNFNTSVKDCKLIHLPRIKGGRKGSLTFIYEDDHIPFKIQRVFYLYDLPGGTKRGGHAHKKVKEILIAVSGSFDVLLDDGFKKKKIKLSRPFHGLYVSNFIWMEMKNFSSGSVCLVFASSIYDGKGCISDHDEFLRHKKNK